MKPERLARQHIVLMGVGHTNAHVVRMWGMNPLPDVDLTCISDRSVATYSGMLPAALAGQITPAEMEIDLVRLCNSVGARLIVDIATGIDHEKQEVLFADRPSIAYDALSVGIGSVPVMPAGIDDVVGLLKIKPMQTFLSRLTTCLQEFKQGNEAVPQRPFRATVVGSGVAGCEILFCLPPFLERAGFTDAELQLVTRSDTILTAAAAGTRRRVENEIRHRGHTITTGRTVVRVSEGQLELDNGATLLSDLVIWATGASAPPPLSQLHLPLDARGFIATDETLRSTSQRPVFAVGDSGTIEGADLPKAGVYAVRQGPILWNNLKRLLRGERLRNYRPQRSFLKLLNLGNGQAIGEWKGLSFRGRWAYQLKNKIDADFMKKFQPVSMMDDKEPMQCRGCGCKLGADSLASALQTKGAGQQIQLEDAAEIWRSDVTQVVASTDFFSSPFDDAYLAGRVAAIHSASDILAAGAHVESALANVVLPEGDPTTQQRMLSDLLAGARREFTNHGASIVGGHTIVGPRLEIGFTVIGQQTLGRGFHKGQLRSGDVLYLTKPVGIGVLLAAQMRSACQAEQYYQMLRAMLQDQRPFAQAATSIGLEACTDVTGFGLAGHLLEMLDGSSRENAALGASLELANIPCLAGAEQAVSENIESSLIDDNLRATRRIRASQDTLQSPKFRLMFDPQTCGGLLFGVPASKVASFIDACSALELPLPTRIGVVQPVADPNKPLNVE